MKKGLLWKFSTNRVFKNSNFLTHNVCVFYPFPSIRKSPLPVAITFRLNGMIMAFFRAVPPLATYCLDSPLVLEICSVPAVMNAFFLYLFSNQNPLELAFYLFSVKYVGWEIPIKFLLSKLPPKCGILRNSARSMTPYRKTHTSVLSK